MIPKNDLRKIALARLKDAQLLFDKGRYDGAAYLCGYAVEVGLKWRICRTLHWKEFPSSKSEFQDLQSFRTHNLEALLHLSGIEVKIRNRYRSEWSSVGTWNPEDRYKSVGTATKNGAFLMMEATRTLLKVI